MSTDFERYILRERPLCSVNGCMRTSRIVVDPHKPNMRTVCQNHLSGGVENRVEPETGSDFSTAAPPSQDLSYVESFSAWLDARNDSIETDSFSERLNQMEDQI